jgi:hypothetical protein
MSALRLTAAGHDLLAHPGHAGGGSVLPGVLLLLLAAAVLLAATAVVAAHPGARGRRRGTVGASPLTTDPSSSSQDHP